MRHGHGAGLSHEPSRQTDPSDTKWLLIWCQEACNDIITMIIIIYNYCTQKFCTFFFEAWSNDSWLDACLRPRPFLKTFNEELPGAFQPSMKKPDPPAFAEPGDGVKASKPPGIWSNPFNQFQQFVGDNLFQDVPKISYNRYWMIWS